MTRSPRDLTEPFDEATQAGARAAYEARYKYGKPWKKLAPEVRDNEIRAFAAGQAAAAAVAITKREE